MKDTSSATEYAALSRLAKADKRARVVLTALIIVLVSLALFGGWRLYSQQHRDSIKRTEETRQLRDDIRRMTDNAITVNKETIHYNTCIFVVPIVERTPAQQRECFRESDLPGGLDEKDFVTVPPDRVGSTALTSNTSPKISAPASSSHHSTGTTNRQSNTSQSGTSTEQQKATDSPPPQPFMVGPIPACVPFTGLCVR